ncbi:MAG: hypothetical protein ACOVK7_03830, partial [Burkholderiaceae bacterium]
MKRGNPGSRRKRLIAVALAALPWAAGAQTSSVIRAAPVVDRGPVEGLAPSNVSALQALVGEGLYSFSGTRVTNLRVRGTAQ